MLGIVISARLIPPFCPPLPCSANSQRLRQQTGTTITAEPQNKISFPPPPTARQSVHRLPPTLDYAINQTALIVDDKCQHGFASFGKLLIR